jgi:16S rRNA (guanine(1405)-N(7))-methyltransferase
MSVDRPSTFTFDIEEIQKTVIRKILRSRKYQALDIPEDTIMQLWQQESSKTKNWKEAEKNVREKLHQIIAPYLGDPDYSLAEQQLLEACQNGEAAVQNWCKDMLLSHSSSKERMPHMDVFYQKLFEKIGRPQSIQDLACAMNPFAFPWMNLPKSTVYYAYDLHHPRINLINRYFEIQGLQSLAKVQDILINTPEIHTDAAFFFKEAHRFEARSKGCCRDFFRRIQTDWLVVTLPAENLTGQHGMRDRQRRLMDKAIEGSGWDMVEFEIETEMVFCIHKYG